MLLIKQDREHFVPTCGRMFMRPQLFLTAHSRLSLQCLWLSLKNSCFYCLSDASQQVLVTSSQKPALNGHIILSVSLLFYCILVLRFLIWTTFFRKQFFFAFVLVVHSFECINNLGKTQTNAKTKRAVSTQQKIAVQHTYT